MKEMTELKMVYELVISRAFFMLYYMLIMI